MDIFPRTISWNPWHGCRKVSRGCLNCYMFEGDRRRGIPGSNVVTKSKTQFDLPIQKDRSGKYRLRDNLVLTSMTSDFFIEEADEWRDETWKMMSKRKDLTFEILTKRPHRIMDCRTIGGTVTLTSVCPSVRRTRKRGTNVSRYS